MVDVISFWKTVCGKYSESDLLTDNEDNLWRIELGRRWLFDLGNMMFTSDMGWFWTVDQNSQQLPNAIVDWLKDCGWERQLPTLLNHGLMQIAFLSSSKALGLFSVFCKIAWRLEQQGKHMRLFQFKHRMSPWGCVEIYELIACNCAPDCCTLKGLQTTQHSLFTSKASLWGEIRRITVCLLLYKYGKSSRWDF